MCDTFVQPGIHGWIFGKNSDREPNEVQIVEYHPPGSFNSTDQVQCTYTAIPQVEKTRGVVISRPLWMWGAEMGVNDKSVAIGNEAVWTREKIHKQGRLTGMDLVRLALERSSTAEEGVSTITSLLERYGQGGACGYRNKNFHYHNSFLVADPTQAWVLETAGEFWAAKKLSGPYAISNGLTIDQDFDLHHPRLVENAISRGFAKVNEPFSFQKAYRDSFYRFFSGCEIRRAMTTQSLSDRTPVSPSLDNLLLEAFARLRNHGEDPYGMGGFRGTRVCAHSANSLARDATQTTASLVASLEPGHPPQIFTTGTSAPCTSVFKPIPMSQDLRPLFGYPEHTMGETSLWWRHEKLHRLVIEDYSRNMPILEQERDELEQHILLSRSGSRSQELFALVEQAEQRWMEQILSMPRKPLSRYWQRQNRLAGFRI